MTIDYVYSISSPIKMSCQNVRTFFLLLLLMKLFQGNIKLDFKCFQIFAIPKYDSKVSVPILQSGIKSADFLVSDDNCTHRLIGLRYDSKTMSEPEITIVCARHEMATAKQIAFTLGKLIYTKSKVSAMLFHNYTNGQRLRWQDYNEVAKIYADFVCSCKR